MQAGSLEGRVGAPVFRPAPSAGGGRHATEGYAGGEHSAVRGPMGRGAGLKTGVPVSAGPVPTVSPRKGLPFQGNGTALPPLSAL